MNAALLESRCAGVSARWPGAMCSLCGTGIAEPPSDSVITMMTDRDFLAMMGYLREESQE